MADVYYASRRAFLVHKGGVIINPPRFEFTGLWCIRIKGDHENSFGHFLNYETAKEIVDKKNKR